MVGGTPRVDDVLSISSSFAVSLEASAIRYSELAGVSLFELHSSRVSRAWGSLRRLKRDPSFAQLLNSVARTPPGETRTVFNDGRDHHFLEVQWRKLGNADRFLLLLRPESGRRQVRATT